MVWRKDDRRIKTAESTCGGRTRRSINIWMGRVVLSSNTEISLSLSLLEPKLIVYETQFS